jgi:hypothetical protein
MLILFDMVDQPLVSIIIPVHSVGLYESLPFINAGKY